MREALTAAAVARVRLFLMDVDGVLTDGKLWFGPAGAAMKAFYVRDGLGIKLLHKHGVATGIVTGRGEDYVRTRAQDLGMSEIHLACDDKGKVVDEILARLGLAREHVCYLGDDINDAPVFARVGVPIAVADAHPGALELARYVTQKRGGDGAVREVADLVLAAQGPGDTRMLNRRAVRFGLLLFGVLGVFVVALLIQEQSIFGKRRRYSPPASASSSSTSPLSVDSGNSDGSASSLSVQGARIVTMETDPATGQKVKKSSIVIGETIGAVEKRTRARKVEVQIFNKKSGDDERVVAIVKGDQAAIVFVNAPDVATGFSGAELEMLELHENVVVDYLNADGQHAATLTTDELRIQIAGGETFYVPRRAVIDQEGTHIEGDGLRYSKARASFSFEKNVLVEGTSFTLPTTTDPAAPANESEPPSLRRITCVGPFDYVPTADPDESAEDTEQPKIRSGVLTFNDDVVGSQADTTLRCTKLEITLDDAEDTDDADDGGGTKISKVVATGSRERASTLVDPRGSFIGEILSLEKTELGDVIVLRNDARIENAKLGTDTADAGATHDEAGDLLNAAAKTLIRVEPLAPESTDAPRRTKILLRDAAYLAITSPKPEESFRIDGEEIDVFVSPASADADSTDMHLERLSARVRARGSFSKGTFAADDIAVEPKEGATDPSDSEITLQPNPRIDLTMPSEGDADTKVVVVGVDCVAVIAPPARDGEPIRARFEGKNTLTVDENGVRTLTMNATRSLTVVAPGQGQGETTVTAVGDVSFASDQRNVHGNGETVVLQILEDDSKRVSILAADSGSLARVTLVDEDRVGNEIRARSIDFDPETNRLVARGSVHAIVPSKMLGSKPASAAAETGAPPEPGTLDCDHLVVNIPVKDPITGETPENLVLEAKGHARYFDPGEGVVATGDRLVFDQATGLATAYGTEDEDALILRDGDDPKVKVQDQFGVAGPVVIMDQATESLVCPDRGSVVIVQAIDPQDELSPRRTTRARSSGPVKYLARRLVLRQNVAVTFEEDGVEDRVLHCDKLTVTFESKDDAEESDDVANSVGGVEKILAEGRVSFEQVGPRSMRAGGDVAEWVPTAGRNVVELRAPSPLCWAESEGPGPDDFARYDGTEVRIRLDTSDLSVGPGLFVTTTRPAKQ